MVESNDITDICVRIRQLRVEYSGERGKAAFARKLNISPSTYDYYEKTRVPPAEVLVRIADLADVDIRWLLTGSESASASLADHPVVARVAKLLRLHPECGGALAAFVNLLAETADSFPEAAGPSLVAGQVTAPEPVRTGTIVTAEPSSAADLVAALVPPTPVERVPAKVSGESAERERQGWIPILGRSAAGVPHFWSEAGGDSGGATMLADLVATMRPRAARHFSRAEAVGELAPEEGLHVQLVLLDAPESPGTAEFVIAEHIARRYDMLFAVRIDGESMEPEISHGDVVVLSPSCPAEPGKPAVVQLSDQIGVTCKLLRFDADRVHLIPINETFAPTSYSRDQLVWALKVIARVRPL